MATNYTLNDVAKIITDGKDFEAITEIGKRFPILAVKITALATKAPEEFKDLMSYMPDHVTANKINKAKFGGFYYENISGNVTYFYVQIPVGVRYEWGWQFGTVTWKINTTQGN
jgi:hypothetical protein